MNIVGPTVLADEVYIIDGESKPLTVHGSFSVETTPLVGHSLCGSLTIEPKFNSLALTGDPLTYDESNRKFTVYSTQSDLIGETKTYSLHVSFSSYPLD